MGIKTRSIVRELEKKYLHFSKVPEGSSEILDAIEIVIRIWEPSWKPLRLTSRSIYAEKGQQSRLIYQFVRVSSGAFSANDAARYAFNRIKLKSSSPPPLKNITSNAYRILKELEADYLVRQPTRPITWVKK